MNPIVGPRYWKKGEDYDLCETEFLKLNPEERTDYVKIDSPDSQLAKDAEASVSKLFAGPGMKFVSDATISDGSKVPAGKPLRKTWCVGSSTGWPAGVTLRCLDSSGPYVGLFESVPPVPAQCRADLSITLMAPADSGQHVRTFWGLQDKNGRSFGDTLFADFVTIDDTEIAATDAKPIKKINNQSGGGGCADKVESKSDDTDTDTDGKSVSAAATGDSIEAIPDSKGPGQADKLQLILAAIDAAPEERRAKFADLLYTALVANDYEPVLAALASDGIVVDKCFQ